ncbi:hypothetical protein [Luteococcus sp.]|uniref:hypothetical protein n=1 Tax=Luteococcus sp. TaxID=1969402 RepID=UPI003735633F
MTLYLVGGGPADSLASVHDQFVAQAKKRGTRIAVALLGTEQEAGHHLADLAEPIRQRWPEAQIEPVWLDDEPEPSSNQTRWPEAPLELAGIVVGGGLTPGYLDALLPQRELIAKLVRQGVPYLGFSAGAAIVAKRAVVGGWRFRGRQVAPEVWSEGAEELQLRDGLGLVGLGIDVHGDVCGLERGLAALEKGELTSLVAIDEGTCLVVDPVSGRTTVEGSQRIHWLSREQGVTAVRHESSAAEVERHAGYLEAEKAAAEAEEQARREAAQKAAAEKAERERAEAEAREARRAAKAAEMERIRAEQAQQVEAEQARLAERQAERDAAEAAERERVAAEKAEQDRQAAEAAEQRRLERERAREQRRAAQERKAAEQAAAAAEQAGAAPVETPEQAPQAEPALDEAPQAVETQLPEPEPVEEPTPEAPEPVEATEVPEESQQDAGEPPVIMHTQPVLPGEPSPVIPAAPAAEPATDEPDTRPRVVPMESFTTGEPAAPHPQEESMSEPQLDPTHAATPSAEPAPQEVEQTEQQLDQLDSGRPVDEPAQEPGTAQAVPVEEYRREDSSDAQPEQEGLIGTFGGLPSGPVEATTPEAAFADGIGTDGDPTPDEDIPEA